MQTTNGRWAVSTPTLVLTPLPPFLSCSFTEPGRHLDSLLKGNGHVRHVCVTSPVPLNFNQFPWHFGLISQTSAPLRKEWEEKDAATHPDLWTSCLSRASNTLYVRGLSPCLVWTQKAGSSGSAGTLSTICRNALTGRMGEFGMAKKRGYGGFARLTEWFWTT